MAADQVAVPKTSRDWWKVAFFVLLFLFEGAREWAVVASYAPPKIAASSYVGRTMNLTTATGSWKRIDGGSALLPNSVRITCWQQEGKCYESAYTVMNDYVGEPNLDVFDTTFSDSAVTYENDNPDCVRYNVRIDLALKKVLATRSKRPDAPRELCQGAEQQVSMILGSGGFTDLTRGHFVPILWLLKKAFGN